MTVSTEASATLSALASRLRMQASACEYEAGLLITQAARERHRATLLRREADRLDELWERKP
jgi:hypothetical protein